MSSLVVTRHGEALRGVYRSLASNPQSGRVRVLVAGVAAVMHRELWSDLPRYAAELDAMCVRLENEAVHSVSSSGFGPRVEKKADELRSLVVVLKKLRSAAMAEMSGALCRPGAPS